MTVKKISPLTVAVIEEASNFVKKRGKKRTDLLRMIYKKENPRASNNAFIRFYKSILPALKQEFPGKGVVVLSPAARDRWRALSLEEKLKYKLTGANVSTHTVRPSPTNVSYEDAIAVITRFVHVSIRNRNTVQRYLKKAKELAAAPPPPEGANKNTPNAFILYYKSRYKELHKENPTAPVTKLSGKAADEWNTLPPEDKAEFTATASLVVMDSS